MSCQQEIRNLSLGPIKIVVTQQLIFFDYITILATFNLSKPRISFQQAFVTGFFLKLQFASDR